MEGRGEGRGGGKGGEGGREGRERKGRGREGSFPLAMAAATPRERKLTILAIDPQKGTVVETKITNPMTNYVRYKLDKEELMGNGYVEAVRLACFGKLGVLFVDENARLEPYEEKDVWHFDKDEYIGRAIVFGLKEEGETDCPFSVEEFTSCTRFY